MIAHVVLMASLACVSSTAAAALPVLHGVPHGVLHGPHGLPAVPVYSQYHAQDELGQYHFGYSGPTASKHEEKDADGTTRGTFLYVDPNGRLQTRSYTADDVKGFRVSASDLASDLASEPQAAPSPAVAHPYWSLPALPAPARTAVQNPVIYGGHDNFFPRHSFLSAPVRPYISESPVSAAPLYSLRAALPAPFVPRALPGALQLPSGISSQYHAQDEAGQYSFGYSNDISSKSETKTSDGVVRGSYSYLDPNGVVQTRSYIADDNGFRVVASDLPQVRP